MDISRTIPTRLTMFGIAAGSVLLGEQLGARQGVGAIVLVLAVSVAARSIPTPKEVDRLSRDDAQIR